MLLYGLCGGCYDSCNACAHMDGVVKRLRNALLGLGEAKGVCDCWQK